ncbi:MAG TPA: glutamate racemase [Nitrospirae bacterium]|nr:glutamate racemase [Nitrospirota bacterium]HDH50392.1 glutamate racemase [Nitrospirota bacterium]HDK81236.1 glutamate racemase [Nitrospirota bacterium]HDO25263.1 glutamate racemase [Nitrospirota bacterium]
MSEKPIGIFDSGIGGLTVLKEIIKELPAENTVYLGDTARVPYGIRSPETVGKYSIENSDFLMSKGIKVLVVACNTSSSISLLSLKKNLSVPVVGVVEPGARAAVARSRTKKIAVIGTETTIKSDSYKKAIQSADSTAEVTGIACPLFVPLVEEGWLEGDVVTLTAEKYLAGVKDLGVDTIVLGCTHYPMIKDVIADVVKIPLIDSAVETAKEVHNVLRENKILRNNGGEPSREFFVTDSPEKFAETGKIFLGRAISNISKITVGA